MTYMDVSLIAIDGFGKELDSIALFWVDGVKVKELLRGRWRSDVDPLACYAHLSREESTEMFGNAQSTVANKSGEFNEHLERVLNTGKSHIVRVDEW